MSAAVRGYLSCTSEKALLMQGHGISVLPGELGTGPREVVDSHVVVSDQGVGQAVGLERHGRVVSGQHVHAGCQGGECTGDVISKVPAGDVGMAHSRLQIR